MGKNFELWQTYNREVTSPQIFIDFSYYYLIAASLQRRVWRGPDHRKLFLPIYPILVGEPGIGKGLIIKQVKEFLTEHKLRPGSGYKNIDVKSADANMQIAREAAQDTNFHAAKNGVKHKLQEEPLLIPLASECVTFEALVRSCSNATRTCVYKYFDTKLQKDREDMYRHASLCFCLEEMSSLFHKDAQKIVNFLIAAYDCGDYTYETKTQDTDYVKGLCLNFFAGTTPGFVEASFSDKLLSEGFASRVWFIYAAKNRKYSLINPPLDTDQIKARATISDHIKKLTTIYGEVKFSAEAWAWMENWWKQSNIDGTLRPNTSDKLNAYYSRKDIHLQKLSILVHFGEDFTVTSYGAPAEEVQLSSVMTAFAMLGYAEKGMHLALCFDGSNPLSKVGKKILRYLKLQGGKTTEELELQFWADVKHEELTTIIDHLRKTDQIVLDIAMRWQIKMKESSDS